MQISDMLDDAAWYLVPSMAERFAKKAAGPFHIMCDLMASLPDVPINTWYNPETEQTYLSYEQDKISSEKIASWHIALRQVPGVEEVLHGIAADIPADEPYMLVKRAADKMAVFGTLLSAAQFKENALNRLWGGPNPLAATIGGSLLGAGLGYGGGWLADQILPEKYFDKKRMRRTGAWLGGLAGALPGAVWGISNLTNAPASVPWWKRLTTATPGYNVETGEKLVDTPMEIKADHKIAMVHGALKQALDKDLQELDERWMKYADDPFNDNGSFIKDNIQVDQFNRVIWNDINTMGGYTPPALAAATTGLLHAASLSQGGTRLITPMDIARIGVGAGSGYVSGLVVGKVLGALAGLKPDTQETLQRAGVWAGLLANVIPTIFR